MDALKWMYTVVAGFSIQQAVRTFALDDRQQFALQFGLSWQFLLLLAFLSVVVRFAHGAIRHFDISYKESPTGLESHDAIVDFAGLFAEGILFSLMALTLKDPFHFTYYYLWLIGVDTLWLLLQPDDAATPHNWLIHNIAFLIVVISVLVFAGDQEAVLAGSVFAMSLLHHIFDWLAPGQWEFYFPGIPRTYSALIVDRWGQRYTRFGNMLWKAARWVVPIERFMARTGTIDIYLAGPSYSDAERAHIADLRSQLAQASKLSVAASWEAGVAASSGAGSLEVTKNSLVRAGLMVVILDGPRVDPRTAWEVGYFYHLHGSESTIGLLKNTHVRFDPHNPANAMIAACIKHTVRSPEELLDKLRELRPTVPIPVTVAE